jgi:Fungal specific transcription factor domain
MLRSFLAPASNTNRQLLQSNQPTPRPGFVSQPLPRIQWSSEGQTLIDAYFNRIHLLIPMLDEPSFRADYLGGQRNDSPWLALLNMVFAMGSIAAMKSDDHGHINFYNRAKEHLGIDSFGSGHLETLQAYALMGGYYLHYINRPNMANSITGAALRMACALGLHRESAIDPNSSDGDNLLLELRRRTWWSLFCLDTWASTTLGRPSLGRWGPAITIRPPEGTANAVSHA